MLTLALSFVDLVDSAVVSGAPVVVTVHVAPRFLHREGLPDEPTREDIEAHTVPDLSLAEERRAEVVTDRAGRATVRLDVDDVWREVAGRRDDRGERARDVVALLTSRASLRAIDLFSGHRVLVARGPDDRVDAVVVIDPAKIVIGWTTSSSTRVRHQLHADPRPGYRFLLELRQGDDVVQREVVATDRVGRSGVVQFDGLRPATTYEVLFVAQDTGTRATTTLASGEVRTLAADPSRWTIGFASCHLPTDGASLRPWRQAASRDSADLLVLVGDQIYGDIVDRITPASWSWRDRYLYRYDQLWSYQPMRDVLRRTPTLTIFDDHEVADDWGMVDDDEIGRSRVAGALAAYDAYQDVLNPPGRADGVYDYGVHLGRVALYVLDERSHRGDEGFPSVLGTGQVNRFRAWAQSAGTRAADVVVVASSVPLAYLPVDRLLDLVGDVATGAGSLLGALAGGVFFGPPGAVVGGFLGALGAAIAYDEHIEDIRSPDLRDQWTHEGLQREAAMILDILFDLANDVSRGVAGDRPRAVFLLGGDVHVGCAHLIRSNRRGEAGRDHGRNPLIYQLISSPVSVSVPDDPNLDLLLDRFDADIDLRHAEFLRDDPDTSTGLFDVSRFVIDRSEDAHFAAEFLGVLRERNIGTLGIERVSGRRYRFTATVEGASDSLVTLFELDLDAPRVRPRDLIGERLSVVGVPVMLRAHDPGSGYGRSGDELDVEAVVELDTQPGRAFGLTLRPGPDEAAHRGMFDLLRTAFSAGRRVTVEYDRTGPRNGTIARVAVVR